MTTKTNKPEEKPIEIVEVGKATEAQLTEWKAKYEKDGPIKVIELVVSPTEVSYGYLKPADSDRMIVAKAMSLHHQNKILEVGEFILNNCWIGGDERMRNDTKMSINAATFAGQTIEFMVGTIKNA